MMNELLTEEFTLQFYEITQKEFERFVQEVGEEIIECVSVSGKKKGSLYVGHTPLAKQETMLWHIDPQFVPMIWEALTNDYGFAPIEERDAHLDLSIAESQEHGKQAWFALGDRYNGTKTPTLTRFAFSLNDYLKPYGIEAACKPCKKSPEVTEIKYKKIK